jgi:hypothetical protein
MQPLVYASDELLQRDYTAAGRLRGYVDTWTRETQRHPSAWTVRIDCGSLMIA